MEDDHVVDTLDACCCGIGEALRGLLECPHSIRRAFGRNQDQGQLCADCLDIEAKLSLVSIWLNNTQEDVSDPEIQDQARDILTIFRGICVGSPYAILKPQKNQEWTFEKLKGFVTDETCKGVLCQRLFKYLAEPPYVQEVLTKRCKKLIETLSSEEAEPVVEMVEPDNHCRSHKALFAALCQYTLCDSCHLPGGTNAPSSWHPARLFLADSKVDEADLVHFDVIISSTNNEWWQDLCIKIPLMTGRKVAFVSDNSLTIPHPHTPLRGFCQIFESNDGCRISLVLQDGCLLRTGVDALKHRVSSGMGISLADVLIQYELSVKQKLSLAHSVALSFWQYYESQLMHRAWTSDTIWFMPEPDLLDGSKRLPLRTYIGFYPEAAECSYDASEFVMTNFLIHRCPRIQYLALVLLQIGLGTPFRLPSSDKQNFQLNTDYSIASAKLEELRSVPWVNFVHKDIFTGAIEKCLKFDVLTGKDKNSDTSGSLASRRRLIYEMVVSPLERLNKSFRRTNAQVDYLSIKQPIPVPESEESHSSIPTSLSATNNSVEDDARAEVFRMRPTDRLGFETAIICALTLEADAVEALFDHHWEDDMSYGKAPGDPNAYSIGVMGRHNVVLVHMSGMGKSAAATAAAACRISFPKINLAILVGVCGAVPVIHDTGERIDLGDVILSNGVIQYDFGRQYPDRFERKDTLLDSMGRAGLEIRSTLNKVKGLRGKEVLKNRMAHYLDKLSKKPSLQANYPTMRDSKASERPRRYPVETADQGVRYQDGVVSGRRLGQSSVNAPNPAIHFGLIASGDTVMKSERQRDEIARRENTIAFEMEGAAVWENFPTLVIKGACDYADSHKTKEFQPYAAATAAACTRAFLDSWESS